MGNEIKTEKTKIIAHTHTKGIEICVTAGQKQYNVEENVENLRKPIKMMKKERSGSWGWGICDSNWMVNGYDLRSQNGCFLGSPVLGAENNGSIEDRNWVHGIRSAVRHTHLIFDKIINDKQVTFHCHFCHQKCKFSAVSVYRFLFTSYWLTMVLLIYKLVSNWSCWF